MMKYWLSLLAVLSLCPSTLLFAKTSSAGQESDKQAAIARSHYNCNGELKTADEIQYCTAQSMNGFDDELKKVYAKVRRHVHAKKQLDEAQQAWLTYRNLQCGKFVAFDSNISPAYMSIGQVCEIDLTDQRIKYLKSLLEE